MLLRRQMAHTAHAAAKRISVVGIGRRRVANATASGARLHRFVMLRVSIRGVRLRLILVLMLLLMLVGVRWLVVLLLRRLL